MQQTTEANQLDVERHARLTAAAPPPVAAKLRAARVSGERKPVTALFADVVGSTSLAERMDPEDWAAIMNDAFERMSEVIYRYEGTIAQLTGDGMLAFFGAPIAHEDDPDRAVRAALEMVAVIDEFGRQLADREGIEFRIRAGINTGRVVVGNIGTDLRYEYTAVGDAVNVAARMQAAARPGSVTITDATRRLIGSMFDTADLGPLEVKGKAEPVHGYEVIRAAAAPQRRRGLPGIETPFIGREAELAALEVAYDIVRAGRGRVVCVLGEAGVGKSRLIATLRAKASADEVQWIDAQCLPYGRTLPYHVLAALVYSAIGMNALAPPEETRSRLRATLAERFGDAGAEMAPYLEHLLALPTRPGDTVDPESADPQAVLDRYVTALSRLLRPAEPGLALGILCEDLHWADAASVDALARLMPMLAAEAVMLIFTARPDRDVPGWQIVTGARELYGDALTELRLSPLDDELSRELVSNLLVIESLPASVRALILERGEGNPFFIEEIVRSLIERGAVVQRADRWVADPSLAQIDLPPTLEGLLQSRIDRLPPDARAVMRLAAVFIRDFAVGRLERLAAEQGHRFSVREQLAVLEASGIIRVSATRPELAYTFRHALLHDAAYESLLKHERRELHRRVAELIEELEADRRGELAPILAEHFDRAGEADRALPYLLEAGRSSLARFANHEARSFYERAAALLPVVDHDPAAAQRPEAVRRRVEIAVGKVQSGWTFKPTDEDLADLRSALPLAEALGDRALIIQAHYWLAYLLRLRGGRYETSAELQASIDRVVELSREDEDALRGLPLALLGDMAVFSGRYAEGVKLLEEALPLLERRGDVNGAAEAAWSLTYAYASLGDFARARIVMERSSELAQRGDPVSRLALKLLASFVEAVAGNVPASIAVAGDCVAESMELGHPVCAVGANFMLGSGYLRIGDPARAIPALERSLELARHSSLLTYRHVTQAMLAAARAAVAEPGQRDAAEAGWEEALAGARAIGDRVGEAQIHLLRGTTLARLEPDAPDRGLADIGAAEAIFEELGAQPRFAEALRAHADVLAAAGREAEADERLRRAEGLTQSFSGGLEGWSPSGLPTLRTPVIAPRPAATVSGEASVRAD
jgi:class 3 adenylate cyclase/tetratricopeptide (TPR) repeat protein